MSGTRPASAALVAALTGMALVGCASSQVSTEGTGGVTGAAGTGGPAGTGGGVSGGTTGTTGSAGVSGRGGAVGAGGAAGAAAAYFERLAKAGGVRSLSVGTKPATVPCGGRWSGQRAMSGAGSQ
jgi:hypothetical protein